MNHNQKGCFAEYHFASTAMLNGFNVSIPLLDSSKYDCILEKGGKLWKIQIKFVGKDRYKHGDSMQITLKRKGKAEYDLCNVDFFALWYEQDNGFFIIKNEGQRTFKLSSEGKYKYNFNNFALIHK